MFLSHPGPQKLFISRNDSNDSLYGIEIQQNSLKKTSKNYSKVAEPMISLEWIRPFHIRYDVFYFGLKTLFGFAHTLQQYHHCTLWSTQEQEKNRDFLTIKPDLSWKLDDYPVSSEHWIGSISIFAAAHREMDSVCALQGTLVRISRESQNSVVNRF